MAAKPYKPEAIILKLRRVDLLVGHPLRRKRANGDGCASGEGMTESGTKLPVWVIPEQVSFREQSCHSQRQSKPAVFDFTRRWI